MKTVHILEDFTGYPNGKDERHFAKGEQPDPELSNEFADLIVAKGHAREVKPTVTEKKEDRK
jgi:hypothetical protein